MFGARKLRFIIRKLNFEVKSYNRCFSNSVTCRRHFYKLGLYKPKSINCYSVTLPRPLSCLVSSRLCKEHTGTAATKSLADELLSTKLSEKDDKKQDESSQNEKEEMERTLRALKFSYYAFGIMITGIGIMVVFNYGCPMHDEKGNILRDEFSEMNIIQQYLYRSYSELKNMNKMIQEPAREQLLPNTLKEPYFQPPYTLVLEMKDVLVHPEWTYSTGWRFKKRPGVDVLLQTCGPPLFEIVIYTSEVGFTAYPVIEKLDSNNLVWYKLFKDSTRYVDGKHLKDLNHLNRDLNKVIFVDWDKDAVTTPRNQLCLPRWDGNMDDTTLVDLAAMLRTIAQSDVCDVRGVLDYYKPFDDPMAAFRENQRKAQERDLEQLQNPQVPTAASWTSTFLRRK